MNKSFFFLLLLLFISCKKDNPDLDALFIVEGSNCEAPCDVAFIRLSDNYINLKWNFGDGNTDISESDTVFHTYGQSGIYSVTLAVDDNVGNEDSHTQSVIIKSTQFPVKADFEIQNNNCEAPCTIFFGNLSENTNSYFWTFGDGTISEEKNPIHEYSSAGLYSVNLEATGAGGTANSIQIVSINPPSVSLNQVTANFTPSAILCTAPCTVSFENTSLNASSYIWDFGDNSGEVSIAEPVKTFNFPGNYLVKLTAFDGNGNSHYVTRSIIVESFGTGIPTSLFLDKVEVIKVPNINTWDTGGYPDLYCELSYSNDNGITWIKESESFIAYDVKTYQLPVHLVCDISLNFCEIKNWTALHKICIKDNDGNTSQEIGCVQNFKFSDFIGDEQIDFGSGPTPDLRIYLEWNY